MVEWHHKVRPCRDGWGETFRVTAKQADSATYNEVVTDPYEAPPLYKKMHENVESFYNSH